MFDFFFYGTLVDADIRRLVLGRDIPDDALISANLSGYCRYAVQGRPYPAAVQQAGASIDGVIMPCVGLRDAGILSCFEGADYEAQLCRVTVPADDVSERGAWVFVASNRVPRAETTWSINDWRAKHKPEFIQIAQSWLDAVSADDLSAAERLWRERLDPPEPR
ncbi:MAG: gamma-glutamylcyclotransferase [Alphaproteobacteria bacterium]|nr:gamma-glutamylcyclotransferase [Alphaproteobacteria bacterium]